MTICRFKTVMLCVPLSLVLGGCHSVYHWADCSTRNFPVVNKRCENWQCITEAGQKASDENVKKGLPACTTPPPKPLGPAYPNGDTDAVVKH
ncbi:MAG TPA: hypothetical protein VFT64_00910 [Rickettsiales bacterium]|nr:hypothetical protein [Rickettsiales bacterium]